MIVLSYVAWSDLLTPGSDSAPGGVWLVTRELIWFPAPPGPYCLPEQVITVVVPFWKEPARSRRDISGANMWLTG